MSHANDKEMTMRIRNTALAATLGGLAWLAAGPLWAADDDGNYAVRGLGATACGDFVTAVEEQDDNLPLVLQWMQGYLTGLNLLEDETFDVSVIQEPGTLAALVLNVCRNDDELILETATAQAVNLLAPARLTQQSEGMTVEADDREVVVRRDTLRQVQERLREQGHYNSSVDGLYGGGTRRALEAFQEAEDLTVTGLPDADTLLRLLVNDD